MKQKQVEQEIQALENQIAKAQIQQQIDMENLRTQLKIVQANADAAIAAELSRLLYLYQSEISRIQTLKRNVASWTIEKARYEADLAFLHIDSAKFVKNFKLQQERIVRNQTADLARYTKELATWQAYAQHPDVTALVEAKKTELEAAKSKIAEIYPAANLAEYAYYAKYDVYYAARENLYAYESLLNSTWTWPRYVLVNNSYDTIYTDGGGVDFVYSSNIPKDGEWHYIGYSSYLNFYYGSGGEIFARCQYGVYYSWRTVIRNTLTGADVEEIVKEELALKINGWKQDSAIAQQDYATYSAQLSALLPGLTAAREAYEAAQSDLSQAKKDRDEALENRDAAWHVSEKARLEFNAKAAPQSSADSSKYRNARKAYDGRDPFTLVLIDPTGGAQGAYQITNDKYQEVLQAYNDASGAYNVIKDDIRDLVGKVATAQSNLDNAIANLNANYPKWEILSNNTRAALQAAVDAAEAEADAALAKFYEIRDEFFALDDLISELEYDIDYLDYWAGTDGWARESVIKALIDSSQESINNAQAALDKAKAYLADITKTPDYHTAVTAVVAAKKADIAYNQSQIDSANAEIAVREKTAAAYEAAIDKLIGN